MLRFHRKGQKYRARGKALTRLCEVLQVKRGFLEMDWHLRRRMHAAIRSFQMPNTFQDLIPIMPARAGVQFINRMPMDDD